MPQWQTTNLKGAPKGEARGGRQVAILEAVPQERSPRSAGAGLLKGSKSPTSEFGSVTFGSSEGWNRGERSPGEPRWPRGRGSWSQFRKREAQGWQVWTPPDLVQGKPISEFGSVTLGSSVGWDREGLIRKKRIAKGEGNATKLRLAVTVRRRMEIERSRSICEAKLFPGPIQASSMRSCLARLSQKGEEAEARPQRSSK